MALYSQEFIGTSSIYVALKTLFFISGNINLTEIHILDINSVNNLKEIDILL